MDHINRELSKLTPNRYPSIHEFNYMNWTKGLRSHKESDFVRYILNGIKHGFDIGLTSGTPSGNHRNMPTTDSQKIAMLEWIKKGVKQGYICGPFPKIDSEQRDLILSPFGAVTQKSKIRPIINLSSPKKGKNKSVNSCVAPKMKSVSYITLKEIVALFHSLGKGSYIWTADAKDAYLIVPIKPDNQRVMGFHFGNYIFYCTTLMFGLASACKIYTHFADAIQYITINRAPKIFFLNPLNTQRLLNHYLDDFFGAHNIFNIAKQQLDTFKNICKELNVPLKLQKLQGPSTRIKLLGWIHETCQQKIYIPYDKICEINELIDIFQQAYKNKKLIKKLKYLSLYGKLRWAFTAIWGGDSLLLTLHYNIFKNPKLYDTALIRVSSELYYDLFIIKNTINSFRNGLSYEWILNLATFNHSIYVDASEFGLGGWNTKGHYFYYKFDKKLHKNINLYKSPDIQFLEMLAIIISIKLWYNIFNNDNILIFTDNEPVEQNIRHWKTNSKRIDKIILMKHLSSDILINNIKFKIQPIRSKANHGADLLSRYNSLPNTNNYLNLFKNWYKSKINDKPLILYPCKTIFKQLISAKDKNIHQLINHIQLQNKKFNIIDESFE